MSTPALVEHFFRHEYGKLVATLCRRVGVQNVEPVEDAVQSALMSALAKWNVAGLPANPSAWLFTVAHNNLIGELRKQSGRRRILQAKAADDEAAEESDSDDLLGMLFVCCEESIPTASQLVFALKTLCGFSIAEIALRLFTSEANVYKRLGRARSRLRELAPTADDLSVEQYATRQPAVREILYLLFTEGYLSAHAEFAIRRELCDEATRLTELLAAHPVGQNPETFALLALMHLHGARLAGRQDEDGGLVLLEEQDRTRWDSDAIATGLGWLAKSAQGDAFTRYHAEAAIAAAHCLAPSFAETRWDEVASNYALLERMSPSALHRLNRAVAVAEWQGPEAGLRVLEGAAPPTWLEGSYLWTSVLADLHHRCGNEQTAARYRDLAIASAPTAAVRALLQRRLDASD